MVYIVSAQLYGLIPIKQEWCIFSTSAFTIKMSVGYSTSEAPTAIHSRWLLQSQCTSIIWGMQMLEKRMRYFRTWHIVGGRVSYKLHYVSFFTANSRRIRFATSILSVWVQQLENGLTDFDGISQWRSCIRNLTHSNSGYNRTNKHFFWRPYMRFC